MPNQKTAQQAEMLANRLIKKYKHLSKWARRTGVGAFRLYDRDIPEIPLVLDFYENDQLQGDISGALYQRPYEKDEKEEALWLGAMREAIAAGLGLNINNVFIKQRQRQRGNSQYVKISGRQAIRQIYENGLRFQVNLSDYLDTGLFLDRRSMRVLIRQEAAEKKVLNLFCYTAAYSVYAAAGGAAETDSLDLSHTYLDWAKENFGINKYKADIITSGDFFTYPQRSRHRLIRGDVFSFLERAVAKKRAWDTIILDPPAFSNSKKMTGILDLKRDYPELIRNCLALLNTGGKLWFSSHARRFSPDTAVLEAELKPLYPRVKIDDLTKKITDEDFRGKKMPLCMNITKSP